MGLVTSESNTSDVLLVEAHGPVRVVVLNRPDELNAANAALHRRIAEVWDELRADRDCRAVVLTGAGRAFCAGGDINLLAEMNADPEYRDQILDEARTIVHSMVRFPHPVIAAVNGPAVGLGCSLAALSDIVLLEERAYFSDPHVSVGLVAADGGALLWPSLMSIVRAKEYLYTGDRIPAKEAVEFGLANRIVAEGTVRDEAKVLAERLAKQPAMALRETKRAINRHLERAVLDILDLAINAEAATSASAEHGAIVDKMRKRSEAKK